MDALVNLRLATFEDLTTDGGILIDNKIYFERSIRTGRLEGPYYNMPGDTWSRDVICHILYKMIYVLHYEPVPDGISCTVNFKEAVPEDLKDGASLKYNFSYYLLANGVLNGPFTITKASNVRDLKNYLDEKRIFVVEHKNLQEFREINSAKKAS
jgi:hypothetical protein